MRRILMVLMLLLLTAPLLAQNAPKATGNNTTQWAKSVAPAHPDTSQDRYELRVGEELCIVRSINTRDSVWLELLPVGHTTLGDPANPDQVYLRAQMLYQVHVMNGEVMPKGPQPVSRRFAEVCGKATKHLPASVQGKIAPYIRGSGPRA